VAGALTKTGQAGAVGGYPIPLIKRALNAFTLGLREVNPKAELKVRWLNSWYAPAAAREASEALIGAGCDLLITTEGSPTAIQVAGEHKLPTFSEGMDMLRFAPDYVASGQLSNWGSIYVDFFKRVHSGEYTAKNLQSVDYFWGLPEGGIEMAAKPGLPLNPRYVEPLKAFKIQHTEFGAISAYDLLQKRLAQLSAKPPAFSSLTGPLKDRKGVLRLEPGKRVTREQLDSMEWCAPGLTGPWPSEP
jgi:simple sugar transport system substrate-binding protein